MIESADAPVLRRCVVAGGSGQVGRMLVQLFVQAGLDVCVADLTRPREPLGGRFFLADVMATPGPVRDELRRADAVVLALPERAALAAAPAVVQMMRPDALLVETLSVKTRFSSLLGQSGANIEVVGLNPMFAPLLGMSGRPVIAVVSRAGPRGNELLRVVSASGACLTRMTAEDHDRLTAGLQALTHVTVLAFGMALASLDFEVADAAALAPPPYTILLALLARIVSGTGELYWDIQAGNPYAERSREALINAAMRLHEISALDDQVFVSMLRQTADLLGEKTETYRDLCGRMVEWLPRTCEMAGETFG
jgi:prephenate dehydrogenase